MDIAHTINFIPQSLADTAELGDEQKLFLSLLFGFKFLITCRLIKERNPTKNR